MNQNLSHSHSYSNLVFEMTAYGAAEGLEARACATPHCNNLVSDPWDETGTLCSACAIEGDLADRSVRWDRLFSTAH